MILLIDIYTITVIGFFVLLAIGLYRDRKHVEVKAYIFFLRKTKKGLIILDKIASFATFWKIAGTIGIIVAFYLMFSGMYVLAEYGRLILTGMVKQPGLNFVFPSPTSQQVSGSGFILIPFWSWIIIIASVIIPHEFLHGVLARVEKIKVKSVGLALFAIFPGAFVEPDERQLKKIGILGKLRIFAAGGFSNFIVYVFIMTLLANVIWPAYFPGSVTLTEVNATSPAAAAGLSKDMVITGINDKKVEVSYSEYLAKQSYLAKYFDNLNPGDSVTLQTANQSFTVKIAPNPTNSSKAYLGITYEPVINGDKQFVFNILNLLTWMWILNYTIAIVNLAPIYPLDGGLIVQALAEKVSKKHGMKITIVVTLIAVAIFLINTVGPFLLI